MWQPDALYAQFFSQEGCEIKVTANFTEEEAIRANRKQMGGPDGKVKLVRGVLSNEVTDKIEKSLEKKDKKAEIRFWNNYIAEKKLEKRQRKRGTTYVDFVMKNVDQSETWQCEDLQTK